MDKEAKLYQFIKGNLINFVIALTSVAYVFYDMLTWEQVETTTAICFITFAINFIVGLSIKQCMGENGFSKGYNSGLWKDSLEKYNKACNLAQTYIELVDNFYFCEEIEKKRNYRRAMLMAYRMKYDWFFDANGDYKTDVKITTKRKGGEGYVLDFKQRQCLKKCIRVKIYNLNLFSEYANSVSADTKREMTDKDQRTKMLTKNSASQIIIAVVGTFFVPMLTGWSWASFIGALIKVAIWLGCGVMQLYTNYNYVAVDKVSKNTRKIELLLKFSRGCEKGLYKNNPYEVKEQEEQVNEEKVCDTTNLISSV